MNDNFDVILKVKVGKYDGFDELEKHNITLEEAYKLIDKYQTRAFLRGVYEFKAHLLYHPKEFVVESVYYVHVTPGKIE